FFDRMLVEIVDDSGAVACGDCQREIGWVSADQWPMSFGIAASSSATHVRVRMYRSDHVDGNGVPVTPMQIDALGRLPTAVGVTDVEIDLMMACFGVASDLASNQTCAATTGKRGDEPTLAPPVASPPKLGDFPPNRPAACAGAPPGMICVP